MIKVITPKPAQIAAAKNNLHLAAIKLNNMKDKNKDLENAALKYPLLLKEFSPSETTKFDT